MALCVGIAFVVMWPILNVSPQLKLRERECVGPVTDPSPRLEPWSRQFVDKLAAEMLELEQKKQVPGSFTNRSAEVWGCLRLFEGLAQRLEELANPCRCWI